MALVRLTTDGLFCAPLDVGAIDRGADADETTGLADETVRPKDKVDDWSSSPFEAAALLRLDGSSRGVVGAVRLRFEVPVPAWVFTSRGLLLAVDG